MDGLCASFMKTALDDLLDEARDVDPHGATLHARGVLALQATLRLHDCRVGIIAESNLPEVVASNIRLLPGHLMTRNDFFRHRLYFL